MTDEQEKREKVINGLKCCAAMSGDECKECPYSKECLDEDLPYGMSHLAADALAMMKSLSAFKEYFDGLYGQGLEVTNWHMNGAAEPFDNFYDSAMEEYENAKRADTQRDYQAAIEMTEYCEHYEPTYNAEDGSM